MADLPTHRSARVEAFLNKVATSKRARVVFIVDATGSRQPAWDAACEVQGQMFSAAAGVGALEIQLVSFGGTGAAASCRVSRWTTNAAELHSVMSRVSCLTGFTQYARAFAHVRKEHAQQPVSACVIVGDQCEEQGSELYDAVAGLGVPVFLFQEGDDQHAGVIFRELARLTNGAFCKFEPGATATLAELLRAVAAFAAGGLTALSDLRTDAARKLLEQVKK
jgi:hypothetical protein